MRSVRSEEPSAALETSILALESRVDELRTTIYQNLTRWQRVQIARHPERPYSLDHIEALTQGFIELHGDRLFGDDPAMVGGFATFKGSRFGGEDQTVMMLWPSKRSRHQKPKVSPIWHAKPGRIPESSATYADGGSVRKACYYAP